MAEWETQSLGDVAQLKMGQSPAGALVTDLDTGLPFLQGNAEFGVQFPTATLQCDEAVRRSAPGDSLISVRAPVGATNRADRVYGIGRGLAAVTFDTLDRDFGHHALAQWSRDLQRVSQGTTFSAIGRIELASLQLPVPPSKEQRRIAEILDTTDETIQATERLIAKHAGIRARIATDLLAENSDVAMPQDWNSDRDRNDGSRLRQRHVGMNNRVATTLLGVAESMIDGPFGSNLKTEHYVRDGGVRVVRLANLSEGRYLNEDEAFIEENHARRLGRHNVRSGDVLVASLGDDNHRPGRACLYPAWFAPGIVKADCFRIRPLDSVDPRFLMEVLNSRSVTSQVRRLAQGVTRDRINLGQLRHVVLQVPSLEEQRRIAEVLGTIDETIEANEEQLGKLRELRSGLAADLLSGRVRTVAA